MLAPTDAVSHVVKGGNAAGTDGLGDSVGESTFSSSVDTVDDMDDDISMLPPPPCACSPVNRSPGN